MKSVGYNSDNRIAVLHMWAAVYNIKTHERIDNICNER
jgi:hypothetical protein